MEKIISIFFPYFICMGENGKNLNDKNGKNSKNEKKNFGLWF